MTKIQAQKDLYNKGKCFSKNKIYIVNKTVTTESALMECSTINDLKEPHIIGNMWRDFKIVQNA